MIPDYSKTSETTYAKYPNMKIKKVSLTVFFVNNLNSFKRIDASTANNSPISTEQSPRRIKSHII
jgi:hypothetical protein